MTVPIIAAKEGAEALNKALTGDIYVRRWTSTTGKGKKKREVEHEAHINPLVLIGTAVGAGLAAVGAGLTLWTVQRKVDLNDGHDITLIIDQIDTTYKDVQVLTRPEDTYTKTIWHEPVYYTENLPIAYDDEGNPIAWKTVETLVTEGWLETITETAPAYYVTKTVVDKPGYYMVRNARGIPYARRDGIANYVNVMTQRQQALDYNYVGDVRSETPLPNGTRKYWRFHSKNKRSISLGERDGFKFIGSNFDIM